jgi:putative methyltransferase (TIGR04325 family)
MKEQLKKIPLLRQLYDLYAEKSYRKKFENDCYSGFWGVFDTFEDAIKAAPSTKSIGYDCAELAQEYQRMLERGDWESSKSVVRSFDYPVLYWLEKIVQTSRLDRMDLFDFGGNLGIHFLTYLNYIEFHYRF